MRITRVWTAAAAMAVGLMAMPVLGQSVAAPTVHQAGTVKSVEPTGMTLATAAGLKVVVKVPKGTKVQVVAPGSKDLKSATDGTMADVAVGDRVLVLGAAGTSAAGQGETELTAVRVILMKAQAIAQTHEAQSAAWTNGGGGIMKSVDAAAGKIVIASGMKDVTVLTTPQTVVRRYAQGSVNFADAKMSTIGAIRPGDQLRVRGTRSADGATITADEMVAGSFEHYSGLITAVNTAAGTVTLKDLATKKPVTVAVTAESDVRRIPPMLAERIAMQMKGGAPGRGAGLGAAGQGAQAGKSGGIGPERREDEGRAGAEREGRAGMDLSNMLSRLPTERLSGLKVGDAVMIVASSGAGGAGEPTAVTLLAGVEAILTATPGGRSMTLSPWSVGGGGEADAGGGGEGAGPQR